MKIQQRKEQHPNNNLGIKQDEPKLKQDQNAFDLSSMFDALDAAAVAKPTNRVKSTMKRQLQKMEEKRKRLFDEAKARDLGVTIDTIHAIDLIDKRIKEHEEKVEISTQAIMNYHAMREVVLMKALVDKKIITRSQIEQRSQDLLNSM